MEDNDYIIQTPKDFILGGKANFTVENSITKNRFTYTINQNKKDNKMYFVKVSYAYGEYMYIGALINTSYGFKFKISAKLIESETPPSVKVIEYIIKWYLNLDHPHQNMIFYHHGHCCRCGRVLTTPESVIKGIGPFCEGLD